MYRTTVPGVAGAARAAPIGHTEHAADGLGGAPMCLIARVPAPDSPLPAWRTGPARDFLVGVAAGAAKPAIALHLTVARWEAWDRGLRVG